MNPNTSGIKTWQWVVTAIVVIALIVLGFVMFGGKSSTPSRDEGTPTGDMSANTGANRIIVGDQYPGNVVFISSVQVEKAGWVVIHADNAGQPGKIIGQAWVDAGISPVKVTLTTSTVEKGTYYAMLHSDDGDKKFDVTKDLPLKDASGNIIMRIFHASSAVGASIKG
ncbi:MAG: hypothetical protein WCG07_02700 [Candidatus Taylorbacteria bacterium]